MTPASPTSATSLSAFAVSTSEVDLSWSSTATLLNAFRRRGKVHPGPRPHARPSPRLLNAFRRRGKVHRPSASTPGGSVAAQRLPASGEGSRQRRRRDLQPIKAAQRLPASGEGSRNAPKPCIRRTSNCSTPSGVGGRFTAVIPPLPRAAGWLLNAFRRRGKVHYNGVVNAYKLTIGCSTPSGVGGRFTDERDECGDCGCEPLNAFRRRGKVHLLGLPEPRRDLRPLNAFRRRGKVHTPGTRLVTRMNSRSTPSGVGGRFTGCIPTSYAADTSRASIHAPGGIGPEG